MEPLQWTVSILFLALHWNVSYHYHVLRSTEVNPVIVGGGKAAEPWTNHTTSMPIKCLNGIMLMLRDNYLIRPTYSTWLIKDWQTKKYKLFWKLNKIKHLIGFSCFENCFRKTEAVFKLAYKWPSFICQ